MTTPQIKTGWYGWLVEAGEHYDNGERKWVEVGRIATAGEVRKSTGGIIDDDIADDALVVGFWSRVWQDKNLVYFPVEGLNFTPDPEAFAVLGDADEVAELRKKMFAEGWKPTRGVRRSVVNDTQLRQRELRAALVGKTISQVTYEADVHYDPDNPDAYFRMVTEDGMKVTLSQKPYEFMGIGKTQSPDSGGF
jgi:ABC-type glycerol-3-phosphate transport system substrate-binding protein